MTQSSDRAASRASQASGARTPQGDHLVPIMIGMLAGVFVLALALVLALYFVLSLVMVPVVALGPPPVS